MKVDYDVAMEVASHEALVRQTYKDSVGVLTWCIGMTNATGHSVERYIGKPASLEHCMAVYVWALISYAEQVAKAFAGRPLTPAQFAAAVSFHWNTGAILRASWVRYWLKGDDARARAAFMNWTKPSSITKRRAKERDLFFDGKWSNDGSMLEYTRVRSNMTPDWGSAKRVNVEDELRAAFADAIDVIQDQPSQPDVVPQAPTVTPDPDVPTADPMMDGVLERGERGATVRELQAALAEHGHYDSEIDGIYGASTERAVRAFQRASGLAVDGDAGPMTLAALAEARGEAELTETRTETKTMTTRDVTPMQQVAKALGGGRGAGEGVTFSSGILILAAWGGWIPADMEAIELFLLNAAVTAVFAPLLAFIRSYRAPRNAD